MSQQPPVVFPMSRGVLLDIAHQNSQSSDENLSFGKTLKEWPSIHLPRRCAKKKFLMIFFYYCFIPGSHSTLQFLSLCKGVHLGVAYQFSPCLDENFWFERILKECTFLFTSRATSWCACSLKEVITRECMGKHRLLNCSLFLCNYPSLWKKKKKNMVWCVFRWVGFLFVIAVYDHCFCLVLVVHRQCTIFKFIAMLKLSWPRCHRKPTIGHPILKIKTVRQLINHHTFKNRVLPMNE